MNLFVEWVGDDWRGIGLLLAAMALSACSITTQVPMSPTATSPIVVTSPSDEMRPLTQIEKTALAKALSQTLKDSNAAQSSGSPSPPMVAALSAIAVWLMSRVAAVGIWVFAAIAMISKGPKGDYIKGRIEHIEGIPVASAENSPEENAVETALTKDNCKEWGYTDFNGAS
jgi:hypothetical protein